MEILYGLQPTTTIQDVFEALQTHPGEWIAVRDLPLQARNQDGLLFLRLGSAPQVEPAAPSAAPTPPVPPPTPAPRAVRPLRIPPADATKSRVEQARAKHVALAEELAAANGGVLLIGHEAHKYRSLYVYMHAHPEHFTHITQGKASDRRNSPEFHALLKANREKRTGEARQERVKQAEELAASSGGMLPPLQELRKIDHGLYRMVLNRPSWFTHVPQAQPVSRTPVRVKPEPLEPEPILVVEPEPIPLAEPELVAVTEPEPVVLPEPESVPIIVPEPIIVAPEPVEPVAEPAPRPMIPLPKPDKYMGGVVVPLPQTRIIGARDPKDVGLEIDKLLSELEQMGEPGEEVVLEMGASSEHHQMFTREVYESARERKLVIGTRQKGSKLHINLARVRTR